MENNFSLYDISTGFVALMNRDEELTEADATKLEQELTQLLKTKSQAIVGDDKTLETMIASAKSEEERIKQYRKSLENKRENYHEYIKMCLERIDKDKIDTAIGTIKLKKCPASVEVTHEDLVPKEFLRIKEVVEVNKSEILKNFKETGEIPVGTNIITNKTKVEIK